jgi:hypothetical protein
VTSQGGPGLATGNDCDCREREINGRDAEAGCHTRARAGAGGGLYQQCADRTELHGDPAARN